MGGKYCASRTDDVPDTVNVKVSFMVFDSQLSMTYHEECLYREKSFVRFS